MLLCTPEQLHKMVRMLGPRSILRAASYLLLTAVAAAAQDATLNLPALEASAHAEMAATKTPGAAIGIVRDGRLIYAKGFGTSNIEAGAPITSETLFRLGSTTKMLTAAAVATLVVEGKLNFQDSVGKYIHGLDPAIAALTVNQLLSHTAGLKDEAVMNGRHDEARRYIFVRESRLLAGGLSGGNGRRTGLRGCDAGPGIRPAGYGLVNSASPDGYDATALAGPRPGQWQDRGTASCA